MIKAKYTVVLDTLLNDSNTSESIKKAMSTYPLYEKQTIDSKMPVYIPTREELNKKILNYYRFREIGFETVGRFLFELETALNEIMPYYNQLFFSADQDYDMLYNADYTRETTIKKDGKTNASVNSETNNTSTDKSTNNTSIKSVNSKTPQGELSITAENIDSVSYADDVTWNKDNSETTGTGTSTSKGNSSQEGTNEENETHVEHLKGNYGMVTFQSLIEHYRKLIMNIEQKIIKDPRIAELFMLVY
jgi:hypothetical protein